MRTTLGSYGLVTLDESFSVLNPTAIKETASATASPRASGPKKGFAARPARLDGGTLAIIDNRAGNRQLRDPLVRALMERSRFSSVILVEKDTVNVPPRAKDWAEVAARATAGIALYGA